MGVSNIQVPFPQELAVMLNLAEGELAHEVQRLAVVKLFEMGRVSSGKAAQLLGISRLEFLDLAGAYEVSTLGHPDSDQLRQDFLNA